VSTAFWTASFSVRSVADELRVADRVGDVHPQMGVRVSGRPREREVVEVPVRLHRVLSEQEDLGSILLVGPGQRQRGVFEVEAVQEDDVGVCDQTCGICRRFERVRVDTLGDQALDVGSIPGHVLHDVGDGGHGGDDLDLPAFSSPGLPRATGSDERHRSPLRRTPERASGAS